LVLQLLQQLAQLVVFFSEQRHGLFFLQPL
jgi:hypothetical protein